MTIRDLDLRSLRQSLDTHDLSGPDVVRAYWEHAQARNQELNAFLDLVPEPPPAGAGALGGVPYALKANIAARGREVSCGSRFLAGYRPPYDATATVALAAAGASLLGMTNMDEFAMGSSCENSSRGPSRNPFAPERTTGGSSGGSAAAVAAGMAAFALGSDTGGSVRQPAGFCGLVGFKPTYGRISRYGLVAFGSSLDQIGPLTRTVEDAALVYRELARPDPQDATTLTTPAPDPLEGLTRDPKGLRIGVPWHLLGEGLDDDVRADFQTTLAALEKDGAEIVEVRLPSMEVGIAVYYVVATAEASSNLARFDAVEYGQRVASDSLTEMIHRSRAEGLGPEVQRRILLGTYVLSAGYYDAYYRKAGQIRTLLRQEHADALATCDVLATPTSPTAAFKLGERVADPLQMYLSDVFTVGANLTGLPSIAVPTALNGDGLPLSLLLTGAAAGDAELLAAAQAVETVVDFRGRHAEPLARVRGGGP